MRWKPAFKICFQNSSTCTATERLLTDFPSILAMDVPALFEDLRRVFPDQDPGAVLRRNPSIAYQVHTTHTHTHTLRGYYVYCA